MRYDFDDQLALRGTHASKYDALIKACGVDDPDAIPMWVADMDFTAAPAIRDALLKEVERGYFGYFGGPEAANDAVAGWYRRQHGWEFDASWVRYTHGVVSGFGDALAACTAPGDAIVLFSPVYHAFYRQAQAMGREVLESPLRIENGRFEMDLDGLSAALTENVKLVVLCSPHNPGGRVWSAEEIRQVADFCLERGLFLISDEIHMDLLFPGETFVPTAVAAPHIAERLVVLSAASKGFNLAGAETGFLVTPDPALRKKLDAVILDRESTPNRFGMAALTAAFTECDDWSDAVRAYLAENFRVFSARMNALAGVSVMDMTSTYLAWVDFTPLGMSDPEIMRRIVEAGVVPSPGSQFGTGGTGHMRFNLALPRPTLETAISRLEDAFRDIQ